MNKKKEQQLHNQWQQKQRDKQNNGLLGNNAGYYVVDDPFDSEVSSAAWVEKKREIERLIIERDEYREMYLQSVAIAELESRSKDRYKEEIVQVIDDNKKRTASIVEELRLEKEKNAKLQDHIAGLEVALKALTPAVVSDDPIERAVQRANNRDW